MKSPDQMYSEIETKFRTGFLSQTMIEVVENITSQFIVEVKVGGDENRLVCQSYISSILFMTGPLNMALVIGVPVQDASEIVAKLTGVEAGQLPEESRFDIVNEIANMVSGRIKSVLNQMGYIYTNSHAFTVSGEDYIVFNRSKIKSIAKRYRAASLEVSVRILFL